MRATLVVAQTFEASEGAMRGLWRNYKLETLIAFPALLALLAFAVFVALQRTGAEQVTAISILLTGTIFIVGTVYGRAKDRREAKRTRALNLFTEWHSPDIRASRIFVSHYLRELAKDDSKNLPSLREIEDASTQKYKEPRPDKSNTTAAPSAELQDAILVEFHCFRIYQFFERWALLTQNRDIDSADTRVYMSSYTGWYFERFIIPWSEKEKDPYLRASLNNIVKTLYRDRSDGLRIAEGHVAVGGLALLGAWLFLGLPMLAKW